MYGSFKKLPVWPTENPTLSASYLTEESGTEVPILAQTARMEHPRRLSPSKHGQPNGKGAPPALIGIWA